MRYEKPAKRRVEHDDCPRASNTVPRRVETSNKSLDSYSLKVSGAGSQSLAANGRKSTANGDIWLRTGLGGTGGRGLLLGNRAYKFALIRQNRGAATRMRGLFVEGWTQNGNHKMGEVRSIVIELKVAHDTVLGQIFGDASFSDAEMVRELGLERIGAAPAGASPQEIGDGYAERLACLDVIVGGEIGIAEQQNAWARRSALRRIQLQRSATQEAAKLHFQKAKPRRKSGIAITAA